MCEDLEDEASLHAMHVVIQSAILLNDTALLEAMFADDAALDVVGALEYEPGVPPEGRPRHRAFLQESVRRGAWGRAGGGREAWVQVFVGAGYLWVKGGGAAVGEEGQGQPQRQPGVSAAIEGGDGRLRPCRCCCC